MKILHIKNVAHVGENIVSGLRQIGVDAELYETIKINKNNLPKIIKKIVGLIIDFTEKTTGQKLSELQTREKVKTLI